MKSIHLQHLSDNNSLLEASFAPSHGMNLLSLKKNDLEIIDQQTKQDFTKRYGGLGPLIGPHFYHRKKENIPPIDVCSIFPHLNNFNRNSNKDPLSHGVGRYCPWNYSETATSISAKLSGLDTYNNTTLTAIEGFNFTMNFFAKLTNKGLTIQYKVKSEDLVSTIGLHYYLSLPNGDGTVTMPCKDHYNDMSTWKKIPEEWLKENNLLFFNLKEEADFGFIPNTKDNSGWALLKTKTHDIKISYQANSEQHAFQLYHPKDSSFVCIEPVSAINPRDPAGYEHELKITIEII